MSKFAYICQTEPANHTGGKNEPMKKFLQFFAVALMAVTLCNCGGGNEDPTPTPQPPKPGQEVEVSVANVSHPWVLTSWSANGAEGMTDNTAIYLELLNNNTFKLYQKNVNFAGVVLFEGNYTLDAAAKTITGKYSDGESWSATYSITKLTTDNMEWTTGSEVSTYGVLTEIPSEITTAAVPASSVRSEMPARFL